MALLPSAPRPFVKLGDISYGLYVWHWPVFMILPWLAYRKQFDPADGELWRWFLLVAVVAVASASWMWFERPINRWAARWLALRSKGRDVPGDPSPEVIR